jgi:hypothetical protein
MGNPLLASRLSVYHFVADQQENCPQHFLNGYTHKTVRDWLLCTQAAVGDGCLTLPSNGHPCDIPLFPRFWYLGMMPQCCLLTAAHPKKSTGIQPLPQARWGHPVTDLTSCRPRHLSFWFRHCPAFIPCSTSLVLPSSNCSLLMAVLSTQHGPLEGLSPPLTVFSHPLGADWTSLLCIFQPGEQP